MFIDNKNLREEMYAVENQYQYLIGNQLNLPDIDYDLLVNYYPKDIILINKIWSIMRFTWIL